MNLLTGNIKKIYFSYLAAAFGGALITSIYSVADMAMVGKYQGSEGTAALAIVAPVWNIIYSFGLLMGIGGSVIFSSRRGTGNTADTTGNQYFSSSFIGSVILALIAWIFIAFCSIRCWPPGCAMTMIRAWRQYRFCREAFSTFFVITSSYLSVIWVSSVPDWLLPSVH